MRDRVVVGLLVAAAAQSVWHLWAGSPLSGYDAESHLQVVATWIDEGRWPAPFELWASFHPPGWHALAAMLAWPFRPAWPVFGIGALSVVSGLVIGIATGRALRGLGVETGVIPVAVALSLFVPCAQFAATMPNNEALAAAFASLAWVAILELQRDPSRGRSAARAGLWIGLALLTKASAGLVAVAALVPFLGARKERREWRAAVVLVGIAAVLAGPLFMRNLALAGTPLPGQLGDAAWIGDAAERRLTLRERHVADYLWLDPRILLAPDVEGAPGDGSRAGLNPLMTNVWGLAYASLWYDAHGVRETGRDSWLARTPLWLGLVPTALALWAFAGALRSMGQTRGRSDDAPLVVGVGLGLVAFVALTFREPATAMVKAAYLLGLSIPAAAFFARGVGALSDTRRRIALAVSAAAAAVSFVAWTPGLGAPIAADARLRSPQADRPLVAQRLHAASAGRWVNVSGRRVANGDVVWRLVADVHPPLNATQIRVWCGYVADAMATHDPGQAWDAVVSQQGSRRLRACP